MPGAVNFKKRISCQHPHDRETYGHTGNADLRDTVYQLKSGRGHIVSSTVVRRLQRRTRVFPLERSAAVYSRLIRSLGIQQTGRFTVRTLFRQLGPHATEVDPDGPRGALESLVKMTCLIRDVSNPPFGHFGEYAINNWLERNLGTLFERRMPSGQGDDLLQQRMLTDLKRFEGSTQVTRLVTRLLRLNLTYTQTAGLLKYVRPACEPKPGKAAANRCLNKKPGFYLSEEAFIDELRRVLGMHPGTRHPVVYIMETADDISHRLAGIEDSVEKGVPDIHQLADLLVRKFAVYYSPDTSIPGDTDNMSFQRMADYSLEKAKREPINKVGELFIRLRVKIIHPLVQYAARQFIGNLETIHAGALGYALMEDGSLSHVIVRTFKDMAMEWMFCHPEVETLGLQGHHTIQDLLGSYAPLLRLPVEEFQTLAEGRQTTVLHPQLLVRRLPSQQIKVYLETMKNVTKDPLQRQWGFCHHCRILQDFVSNMADQRAQDEYRASSML